MKPRMKWHIWLGFGLIMGLLWVPLKMYAQGFCPQTVYISSQGTDKGVCTDSNAPCATLDYALQQGQSVCRNVDVINLEQGSGVIEWRPPSTGKILKGNIVRFLPQVGPALGLVVGWVIAYAWFGKNRKGGAR